MIADAQIRSTYRKQFTGNSEMDKYVRMVTAPFNSETVRGPSKFFQPTSLLTYRLEYDFAPGTTTAACVVLPHAFALQQATNGFAWFNVNKDINPGVTTSYNYGSTAVTFPNQVYVHPLAGGGSVNNNPVDQSTTSFTDSAKRWTSARTLATGIRVYATGQVYNRSGTLTLGILPGKSQSYNGTSIPVPGPSGLRQYPTSYEISAAQIPATGTDLIWLPLDPNDDCFIQGNASIAVDDQTQEQYYRNQMWILFNGIQTVDTFRIEVVCHVEYIPTLPFGAWSPPEAPTLDNTALTLFLKSVRNVLPEVISGDFGRKIAGALEVGRKIGQGMQMVSSLM